VSGPRGPVIDTATPHYVEHPPASSGWLPDGAPLDSGTAAIVHNNLSVLAWQSTRLIGHAQGPGAVDGASTQGLWATMTFIDASPDTTTRGSHPWVQGKSAVCLGPWVPSATRIGTAPPGLWPRKVRVILVVDKSAGGGSQLDLMAALCSGPDTPLTSTPVAWKERTLFAASAGSALSVVLDVEVMLPLAPRTDWPSRGAGASLAVATPCAPLWLWVGWRSNESAPGDAVYTISAFEVME